MSGALLLTARGEFLELGGFDERLFLYYEDQELSRRYSKHGLPLSVTQAISASHLRGGSSGAAGRLRPLPTGASALSSIEFVAINHGPRAGRYAWILYRGLCRCATLIVKLTAKGPLSARSARKRAELRDAQSAAAMLLDRHSAHYPVVKTLARASNRS